MRPIALKEVQLHKTLDDCWMAINGRVYNVTPYVPFHPGGVKEIMKGAGKDATALIHKIHAWVNVEQMLAKCLLGPLRTAPDSSDDDDDDADDD